MRLIMILMLFSLMTAQSAANAQQTSSYGGRDYIFVAPPVSKPMKKIPLIIVMHGGMGNANHIMNHLDLNTVALQHGYAVAYINGTGGNLRRAKNMRTWNAGTCCGPAERENIDDVGYIDEFITSMIRNHNIDPAKIYLAGHSNGAMMAYRFACERPGRIAAIVPVSGALLLDHCNAPDLRVLHIHGDQDQNVPVQGGEGPKAITKTDYPPLARTIKSMKAAGANVTLKLLPKTDHNLDHIDQAIKTQTSLSLGETMIDFFSK